MQLSFLPVVVPTRAATALAIATHVGVDVTVLDVTTTKTSGEGDMWVGASSAMADVATFHEVAVGVADIRIDRGWFPGKPPRASTGG
jgi:hypothetical protein